MTDYDVYLFDFDFTLVNALPGIVKSYNYAFQTYGLPARDDLTVKNTVGLPVPTSFMLMNDRVDETLAKKLEDTFTKAADVYMNANTSFLPGSRAFLEKLTAAGKRMGVVTTKKAYRIHEFFASQGMADCLSLVIGGEEVKVHKPDPEGLLLACAHFQKQFGIPKERVLYIGDNEVDAGAAEGAGVDFAAVLTGTTPREAFLKHPHKLLCADMTALAEALLERK